MIHTADPTAASKQHACSIQELKDGTSSYHLQPTSTALSNQSSSADDETVSGQFFEILASADPQSALANADIASVFRHYVDILASWYDLCDDGSTFARVVPIRSLGNPVLFKALIAFSAYHKSRTSGDTQGLGLAFHAACVQDLLHVMDNSHPELQGDYLAATCLLRSYEIQTGTVVAGNRSLELTS